MQHMCEGEAAIVLTVAQLFTSPVLEAVTAITMNAQTTGIRFLGHPNTRL